MPRVTEEGFLCLVNNFFTKKIFSNPRICFQKSANFLSKTSQILENHSVSHEPIRKRDTSEMAPMITAGLTMKSKPNYRDKNNFFYVFNRKRAETKNWRCSKRSRTATLTPRISTGNLVGDVLPTHGHTNKLLKN